MTVEGSEIKEKQKSSYCMAIYTTVIAWEDMAECDVKNCVNWTLNIVHFRDVSWI